jgi:undecaprenyl-diphosphatase
MQRWNAGRSELVRGRRRAMTDERRAASVAVVGAALLALLAVVATRSPVDSLDRRFSIWAHARGAGHHRVLQLVTDLGSWPVVVPLAIAVCLAQHVRGRVPLAQSATFLAAVLVGQELLQRLLKQAIGRPRPSLEPVAATLGPAFPSGHSATAAAFYAGAALLLARRCPRRSQSRILAAGVALGVVVAATRVLLAVHWASDVAGGLALGWTWLAVCTLVALRTGGRRSA